MKVKLKDFVVPTMLENKIVRRPDLGDHKTEDLVFIRSIGELKKLSKIKPIKPTDYALMNNSTPSFGQVDNRWGCVAWSRTVSYSSFDQCNLRPLAVDGYVDCVCNDGYDLAYEGITRFALWPALHLGLESVISARNIDKNAFKMWICTRGDEVWRTIEFGEYPKTYVGKELNIKLNELLKEGKLTPTNKTYTGWADLDTGRIVHNQEYEFEGNKYVRVKIKLNISDSLAQYYFSDETIKRENTKYLWVKVEPIKWVIDNWDMLPTQLNPQGSGEAEYIDIQTQEAITSGIPFSPSFDYNVSNWRTSRVRKYLNGIEEFSKNNFLSEALDMELELNQQKTRLISQMIKKEFETAKARVEEDARRIKTPRPYRGPFTATLNDGDD